MSKGLGAVKDESNGKELFQQKTRRCRDSEARWRGGGASDGFEREQWGQTGNSHRAAGSHGALGPPSGLGSWLGVR